MGVYLHDVPFNLFLKYYKKDNSKFISQNARYQPIFVNVFSKTCLQYYKYSYIDYTDDENGVTKDIIIKIDGCLNNNLIQYGSDLLEKIFHLENKNGNITFIYNSYKSEEVDNINVPTETMLYKPLIYNSYITFENNQSVFPYFGIIGNKIYPFLSYNENTKTFVSHISYLENVSYNSLLNEAISKNTTIAEILKEYSFTDEVFNFKVGSTLYTETDTLEIYYPVLNSDNVEIGRIYKFNEYKQIKKTFNNENIVQYHYVDTYDINIDYPNGKEVFFTEENMPLSPIQKYHNYMRKYKNSLRTLATRKLNNTELYFQDEVDGYSLNLRIPIKIKAEVTEDTIYVGIGTVLGKDYVLTSVPKDNLNLISNVLKPKIIDSNKYPIPGLTSNIIQYNPYGTNTNLISIINGENSSNNNTHILKPIYESINNINEEETTYEYMLDESLNHKIFSNKDVTNINLLPESNEKKILLKIANLSTENGNIVADNSDIEKVLPFLIKISALETLSKCIIKSPTEANVSIEFPEAAREMYENLLFKKIFNNSNFYFFSKDDINIYVIIENYINRIKNVTGQGEDEKITYTEEVIPFQIFTLSKFLWYIITSFKNEYIVNFFNNEQQYFSSPIFSIETRYYFTHNTNLDGRVSLESKYIDADVYINNFIGEDNDNTDINNLYGELDFNNSSINSIRTSFHKNNLYINNKLVLKTPVSETLYEEVLKDNAKNIFSTLFTTSANIFPISAISNLAQINMYLNSIYVSMPNVLTIDRQYNTGINFYSQTDKENKYGFLTVNDLNVYFDSMNEKTNSTDEIDTNYIDVPSNKYIIDSYIDSVSSPDNTFERLFNYEKYSINLQEAFAKQKEDIEKYYAQNSTVEERDIILSNNITSSVEVMNKNNLQEIIDQFIILYSSYIYDDSSDYKFYTDDYKLRFENKINNPNNELIKNNFNSSYNLRYRFDNMEETNKNILIGSMKTKYDIFNDEV